jgi:cytochrome P450
VHLARAQTAIAVDKLLSRLPNLTLVAAVPPAGFAFRRPGSLELSWRV